MHVYRVCYARQLNKWNWIGSRTIVFIPSNYFPINFQVRADISSHVVTRDFPNSNSKSADMKWDKKNSISIWVGMLERVMIPCIFYLPSNSNYEHLGASISYYNLPRLKRIHSSLYKLLCSLSLVGVAKTQNGISPPTRACISVILSHKYIK
jgi:hypothetical protein